MSAEMYPGPQAAPADPTAPASPQKQELACGCLSLAVLTGALAIVSILVFVPAWRSAATAAGAAGVVLAAGGWALRMQFTRPGPPGRRRRWWLGLGVAGYLGVGTGLVLTVVEPAHLVCALALCVAPGLVIGGHRGLGRPGRRRAYARLVPVVAVLLPFAILGVAGNEIRDSPGYYARYGTLVEARLPRTCLRTNTWTWSSGNSTVYRCNVAYTVAGRDYLTTVDLAPDDRFYDATTVFVYAIGGKAASRGWVHRVDPATALGRYVPAWFQVASAAEAVLILGLLVLARVDPSRRRGTGVSPVPPPRQS